MPKTKRASILTTRLSSDDTKTFRELALARRVTQSELLRECALRHLEQEKEEKRTEIEAPVAAELKRNKKVAENTAVEVHALLQVVAKGLGLKEQEVEGEIRIARETVLASHA